MGTAARAIAEDVDVAVVDHYLLAMRGADRRTGRSTTRAARTCQAKISRAGGWARLGVEEQIDAVRKARSFGSWLMVTGQAVVDPRLLSSVELRLGNAARLFCAEDYRWFSGICRGLTTPEADMALQWNTLAKITAITGVPPAQIGDTEFADGRTAILDAHRARDTASSGRAMAAVFHRLRLTLFHAGRISSLHRPAQRPPVSVTGWSVVAPGYAETARRYVEQVRLSLRPATVSHLEHDLRRFGAWLADTYPDVASCADLDRGHVEAFKTWLATHPTKRTGKPLNRVSVKNTLINLHCFFDRIAEWDYPNPPSRPLVFIGDLPIIDKPLPRFLDDAAAAKLLRIARTDPDPLSRLIVELLARTGVRIGELLALNVDAIVQIGSAYWLRIPIGKMHNDRYIPLHPQLKELLDDWITHHRPRNLRSNRLLIEHNRPITRHRVSTALHRLGDEAGIGHVTAHRLRHTLATQAINRGMSLDAIAALLGHYAGDLVKWISLGGCVVEAGQQAVEDLLATELALGVRVVALALQGGAELDGGLEEGARLADRLEVAVQSHGSGAVAVAEHPSVHFGAQLARLGALGVAGQRLGCVVEGFDLFRDREVLVGHGAVGDAGINHGHPHRAMPQQSGDGLQRHAPVDRLGGQGVAQLVRCDVPDARGPGGLGDRAVHPVLPDASAVLEQQVGAAQPGRAGGDPVIEEPFELRVQGYVAVAAQLAQRARAASRRPRSGPPSRR